MSAFKTLLFATALQVCSFSASADELENINGTYELPVTLQTLLERSGRDNLIHLAQLGDMNQANLIQSGNENYAELLQVGLGNQADITQLGERNQIELDQIGNDNQAAIIQVGDNNLVQLNQLGSANFSIEQIADNASISITQY